MVESSRVEGGALFRGLLKAHIEGEGHDSSRSTSMRNLYGHGFPLSERGW